MINDIVCVLDIKPFFSTRRHPAHPVSALIPHQRDTSSVVTKRRHGQLWWIQEQACNRAFGLIFRVHHRIELIWSMRMNALHKAVRMSPYILVYSNYCVRGHGLKIAPGGTSLDNNNKISITTASSQKIIKDSESYVSGLFYCLFCSWIWNNY